MSTIKRLVSGSAATWTRIGVTMFAQVALVPIYLSKWDQETYGAWLAILAMIGVTTLFDVGHQTYVGFEFVRIGADRREIVQRVLSAAVPFGMFLGLLQLGGVVWFVWALGGELGQFGLGDDSKAAGQVLILQSAAWSLSGSVGGVLVRVMAPFGHYPRFAWWGVFTGAITAVVPAVAVWRGAGLLEAGIVCALTTVFVSVPLYVDMWLIMRRERLTLRTPDWALGLRNLGLSLGVTVQTLLGMARQQGTRLVLSPLAGAGEMAAFATMRTGANIALQGLGTVTNPLLPELMRFLNQRDQDRIEAAFGTVWLIVAAGMAPAVVVVQAFAPYLFPLWTHGKIAFDPVLFGMLSLGVLIFALAQPAMALVQGHNLLRPQMVVSALAGATAVGGMCLLVPILGIRGAALALMLAELVALAGYAWVAALWLAENGLRWPFGHLAQVSASVVVSGAGMFALAFWPGAAWEVVSVTLLLLGGCLVLYWRSFPEVAKSRVVGLVAQRLRFLSKFKCPQS